MHVRLTSPARMPRRRHSRLTAAGAAALCAAYSPPLYLLTQDPALTTGPAEQKTVDAERRHASHPERQLPPARCTTTTHIRQVTLTQGEAFFNVTKHQSRPFVVLIGTARSSPSAPPSKCAATTRGLRLHRHPHRRPRRHRTLCACPIHPAAGSRTRTHPTRSPVSASISPPNSPDLIDPPSMERVTAWQHGQLIFEDASLRDAAHEFNRYGTHKLTDRRDVPATSASAACFASAIPKASHEPMANAYQLRIINRGGRNNSHRS